MIEAGIGRLLVASLHQAITEVLPTRLEFYEEWLSPRGLRDGRMGLAPLQAVLSFLRKEGDAYEQVMIRAGELAAEWWLAELPGVRRSAVSGGPLWIRGRLLMGLCQDFVRQTFRDSDVSYAWSQGQGQITLGHSVFCVTRESATHVLCGFYVSALRCLLAAVGLPVTIDVTACRSAGAPACVLTLVPEAP